MNASELVVKAFYLSDVVSRQLETVSGSQISDGIELLNDLLNDKAAKGNLIPYYTHTTFNAVTGQEKYYIPSLMEISALTFENGNIRYNMHQIDRNQYFGSARATNIQSFPTTYEFERAFGGSNVYVYFLPNDDYEFQITGKFFLSNVDLCTDISSVLDGFYISYLKYALAKRISDFYNLAFLPAKQQALNELEKNVFRVDPIDMTIKKISTFNDERGPSYGFANLFRGFVP